MRRLFLLFALVGGCNSTCGGNLAFSDTLANAAPGALLQVTTSGCSTCGHTSAQVLWSGPTSGTTGTIDLVESPSCFVVSTTVSRTATNGVGDFSTDWNSQNCGDQVDTLVQVTNHSNVTFTSFEVHVDCPKYVAPM